LLKGITGGDLFAGFLSTLQAVVPGRREPIGQDREGLAAWLADSLGSRMTIGKEYDNL